MARRGQQWRTAWHLSVPVVGGAAVCVCLRRSCRTSPGPADGAVSCTRHQRHWRHPGALTPGSGTIDVCNGRDGVPVGLMTRDEMTEVEVTPTGLTHVFTVVTDDVTQVARVTESRHKSVHSWPAHTITVVDGVRGVTCFENYIFGKCAAPHRFNERFSPLRWKNVIHMRHS